MDKYKSKFPKDFFWGASTASHQVEGGTRNQWTEWEKQVAEKQAKTAKKRLGWMSAWESVKKQAEDPDNYISGEGVNHYEKYEQDFDIAKEMNLNSFRFGIEWSRVEPVQGQWNRQEIQHYKEYITALKKRGLEPFLNLWHWTQPVWFEEKGGFARKSNIKYFEQFVHKISEEFGSDVKYVITLNEPNVYASFSFGTGEWPPQETSWLKAIKVYKNLIRAHKAAYKILKKENPKMQIGIAAQLANIQAKRPHNFLDQITTKWMRHWWNWWFLNKIHRYQDFVGFNYYFTDYYRHGKRDNPEVPLNDLGWYMEPEGLYPLLLRVWAHYKKPIFVTENGVADADDQFRQWWLEETVLAIERALSEDVDVRGYFHWSLLDNFEWAYGWWPKFGLVEVDRQNDMKRKVRKSAKWYADFIEQQQNSQKDKK